MEQVCNRRLCFTGRLKWSAGLVLQCCWCFIWLDSRGLLYILKLVFWILNADRQWPWILLAVKSPVLFRTRNHWSVAPHLGGLIGHCCNPNHLGLRAPDWTYLLLYDCIMFCTLHFHLVNTLYHFCFFYFFTFSKLGFLFPKLYH